MPGGHRQTPAEAARRNCKTEPLPWSGLLPCGACWKRKRSEKTSKPCLGCLFSRRGTYPFYTTERMIPMKKSQALRAFPAHCRRPAAARPACPSGRAGGHRPSAVLMEASTGQVLFEKDPHALRSCASITKVMTLCLVFQALDSGQLSLDQTLHRLRSRGLHGGTRTSGWRRGSP